MTLSDPSTSPDILPLLAHRRSLRAFDPTPVEEPVLARLLEAARWAPSSRNAQPWHFVVIRRGDVEAHVKAVSVLTGRNSEWAPAAPLLLLALARVTDEKGRSNRHAPYDLGQAVAQLVVQASAEGLQCHQMGGFDAERARELFEVPDSFDLLTFVAVGHAGDASALPDELRALESAPRRRRGLAGISSSGRYEA